LSDVMATFAKYLNLLLFYVLHGLFLRQALLAKQVMAEQYNVVSCQWLPSPKGRITPADVSTSSHDECVLITVEGSPCFTFQK
jgi:hypothetical protein